LETDAFGCAQYQINHWGSLSTLLRESDKKWEYIVI